MAIKFLSGQTITGNITLSGDITAATFNSFAINSTGTNNVANEIVRTQGNGYVNFGWINSVSGNHTGSITRITASNDQYLRYVTPAQFRTGVTDGFYAPSSTVTGVTSVATGNGLSGGTIISTGTLTMSGSYTGDFTVSGIIRAASNSFKCVLDGSANTLLDLSSTGSQQIRFFDTDSSYTEAMRILRYNDLLVLTYGDNANEEALTVVGTGSSAGYIGIGTTSPTSNLDVFNSTLSTLTLSYPGGGNNGSAINFSLINAAVSQPITTQIKAIDDGAFRQNLSFLTKTSATGSSGLTERIRLTGAGNVGIGIASPTRQLSVLSRIACVVSGTTANAAILFGDDDDDSQGQVRYNNSDDSMELRTNSTERIRISSNGTTKITTDGTEQLILHRADSSIFLNNTIGTIKVTADDPTANVVGGQIQFTGGGTWSSNNYPTNIIFSNDNAGTLTERMRITSAGKVGIGTSDIGSDLQVGGTDLSVSASFSAQFAVLSEATTGYPSGFMFLAPRVATSSNRVLLNQDFGTYFSSQVYATSNASVQSDTPIVFAPTSRNWNRNDYTK